MAGTVSLACCARERRAVLCYATGPGDSSRSLLWKTCVTRQARMTTLTWTPCVSLEGDRGTTVPAVRSRATTEAERVRDNACQRCVRWFAAARAGPALRACRCETPAGPLFGARPRSCQVAARSARSQAVVIPFLADSLDEEIHGGSGRCVAERHRRAPHPVVTLQRPPEINGDTKEHQRAAAEHR